MDLLYRLYSTLYLWYHGVLASFSFLSCKLICPDLISWLEIFKEFSIWAVLKTLIKLKLRGVFSSGNRPVLLFDWNVPFLLSWLASPWFFSFAGLCKPLKNGICGLGRGCWLSQGASIPLSPFCSLWLMNSEEEKEENWEEIKLQSLPWADWVITVILCSFVTVASTSPFKISSQFHLYFAEPLGDAVNVNELLMWAFVCVQGTCAPAYRLKVERCTKGSRGLCAIMYLSCWWFAINSWIQVEWIILAQRWPCPWELLFRKIVNLPK